MHIHNVICPVFFPTAFELVKAGSLLRVVASSSTYQKPSLAATGEINQTTPGTAILNIHYIVLRHATPLHSVLICHLKTYGFVFL